MNFVSNKNHIKLKSNIDEVVGARGKKANIAFGRLFLDMLVTECGVHFVYIRFQYARSFPYSRYIEAHTKTVDGAQTTMLTANAVHVY